MPITPNFSTSQASGNLDAMTITDTSTGSDGTITGRLIYLRKYDGTYLTPTDYTVDYIFWPYSSSSLTVEDLLDKDYCLDITVYWYIGSGIGYSKTILTLFRGYTDTFLRNLTRAVASNRTLITRPNYWQNKQKLRVLIDDAAQATEWLNDQTISTFCLDECEKLTNNISTFF